MSRRIAAESTAGEKAAGETAVGLPAGEGRRARTGLLLRLALGMPLLVWQIAFFLVPLLLMFAMTFWVVTNFRVEPAAEWSNWQRTLADPVFYGALGRTLLFALITAVLGTVLGLMFSFAVARGLSPRAQRVALMLLIVPFFTSYLVRIFSWQFMLSDNGVLNVIARTIGLSGVNLLDTPVALIIGYLSYSFPLICVILILSINALDLRLEEAGRNLGAGPVRVFTQVTLTALKPSLVAAAAFTGILAFGDVITPQVLGGGNYVVLGNLVVDTVKGGVDFPRAATIGVAMVVTIMTVTLLSFVVAFPAKKKNRRLPDA